MTPFAIAFVLFGASIVAAFALRGRLTAGATWAALTAYAGYVLASLIVGMLIMRISYL